MSANLPPNPNLTQLKNQAKDLLVAYQSGDSDAIDRVLAVYKPKSDVLTLREAQQALAREYGFSSWQALVDKVKVDEDQLAVLKQVIDSNDVERLRQMISDDPSLLDLPSGYDKAGPLTWAAECRGSATPPSGERLEIARILMDAGADPNEHSGSPLMRASLNDGRIPMMELLVSRGADVNTVWKTYGPMIFAPCETLAPKSIRWLIARGADPNFEMKNPKYVGTAMDMALCTYDGGDRKPCVTALIEGGANFEDGPEMDIHRGRLDLLENRLDESAALVHSHSMFRQSKEYGGLYGGCALRNPTLLHICAEFGELEAARVLLSRGADVNARAKADDAGVGTETPIFHTVTSNHNRCFELLEWLIENGADLTVRATVRVPKHGGPAFHDDDTVLEDVTPLGYVMHYPNDYQPGPGSGNKGLDTNPHENVVALLKAHGALE